MLIATLPKKIRLKIIKRNRKKKLKKSHKIKPEKKLEHKERNKTKIITIKSTETEKIQKNISCKNKNKLNKNHLGFDEFDPVSGHVDG